MKLSIVIVNYNVRYFLDQALLSVYKSTVNFDFEVFVVDNNSTDGSLEMLKHKFPQVTIIANKENVGFAKANNQAIRVCTGEYVLLLNPDTIIQENTLQCCVAFMDEHSKAGGLGVKMYDGAGNFLPESKRGFPTPMAAIAKMSGLSKLFSNSTLFGKYHLTYLDKNKTHKIEVLSGAYMFLRKSVLEKTGVLDEDFFMYGEDIDLSYRIIQNGFDNYYLADTSIIHFKGESTKKGSLNYILTFYNAMLIFSKKHLTGTQGKLMVLLLQFAIYLRAILAVIQKISTTIGAPVVDTLLIIFNIYILQLFWEHVVKAQEHLIFPLTFLYINMPIYILSWLFAMWLFGVYTKRSKWKQLVVGLLGGTLIIAICYAFFPNFLRTSRGIIIVALLLNILLLSAYRLVWHWINGTLNDYFKEAKKYIIIGNSTDAISISNHLQKINAKYYYIGFVSQNNDNKTSKNLGVIDDLEDVITAYQPNEILFSTQDVSTQFIIETMAKITQPIVYRLVSKGNTIISSNSKNTSGEIYSFDINLSNKNSWLDRLRNWI